MSRKALALLKATLKGCPTKYLMSFYKKGSKEED